MYKRQALLSVTEGEDKPQKYPTMFNSADVALITKIDLAEACEFDRAAAHAAIHDVRPGMTILELSAKRGTGTVSYTHLDVYKRQRQSGCAPAHPQR